MRQAPVKQEAEVIADGSYRNHCPVCLWSRHVDNDPGDRASACRGLMLPGWTAWRPGKGLVIMHCCVRCGFIRANRIASDTDQPDDIDAVAALALAPPRGPRRGHPRLSTAVDCRAGTDTGLLPAGESG